ncbi:MAG TPA: FtsK/SpoIIIE domain-containing protein [Polyangiaceae bacterium]|nr:FtsK/SpoIIIE domain-containing protein [Polyangiaceae bacterium]
MSARTQTTETVAVRDGDGESERFSVTEVRNALRCPRVFALGRLTGQSVTFPLGSSCLGATFHRLVERFARQVDVPPSHFASLEAGAARDDVENCLARWLLDLLVDELEQDPTYWSIPGEVDDLAEALREFARHLSARLQGFAGTPSHAVAKLLHAGERSVEARLGQNGPVVHGRLDAIFADQHGALDVIEYKLTDEANEELDRAQVALYREILRVAQGVEAQPVVLRFSPLLREVSMSNDAADRFVASVIEPLLTGMQSWGQQPLNAPATQRRDLCAACPMARPCAEAYPHPLPARDDPPMGAARPRPNVSSAKGASTALPDSDLAGGLRDAAALTTPGHSKEDETGRIEAEELRDRILAELNRQGVAAVAPKPPVVGPTLYIIEVARPRGAVSHLDRAAEDVRHRLAAESSVDVDYAREGGHRRFVVRRREPRKVMLAPLLELNRAWLSALPGRLVVGQTPEGSVLCADLADAGTPHLLIAGQSGSGKSVLIQSIIASLVQFHGPAAIRFTLIDPKRVTFIGAGFKAAVAAHLDGPIRFDLEDTLPAIQQLVDAMEERYRIFEAAQVADIREFNEQAPATDHLERRVLVIDEFQDLISDRSGAQAFFSGVKRLGAKARAAGIHLILATQRPDRDTVPPVVKANLGGKIALQVATKINSRIVLDEGGAEKLLGKGDLLANLGRGVVRAQAPLLSER